MVPEITKDGEKYLIGDWTLRYAKSPIICVQGFI